MEWFEANDLIERYPGIAVTGALQFAIDGRPAATERWADAAEATSTTGVLSDGNTIEGMLAYLRANLCRDGIEAMRRDAQEALHGLSPASPFRANMIQVEGLSHLLEGDADRADAVLRPRRGRSDPLQRATGRRPRARRPRHARRSNGTTGRQPARSPIRP